MAGALEGLLVLDLTSNLAGPYAAMMLADHGADVIKIEQPGSGDAARNMPPFVNGESAPFMIWNRNKRSVTMDLKKDREAFLKLVDRADFVVENFRAGVMPRLGLDWQALPAPNPSSATSAGEGNRARSNQFRPNLSSRPLRPSRDTQELRAKDAEDLLSPGAETKGNLSQLKPYDWKTGTGAGASQAASNASPVAASEALRDVHGGAGTISDRRHIQSAKVGDGRRPPLQG